jgi:hypothetical protein
VNINFDYSSADEALCLLTKLQRAGKVSFRDWHSLFKTGGYKALLENKASTRAEIKSFLTGGSGTDLPGAALLQENVEDLSAQSEEMGILLGDKLKEWLPESLTFEHFSLAHALYGGESEAFDPAVIDLSHVISLEAGERKKLYVKLSLTLLIKRFQNLERFYLKNFVAIRRYMPFIYTLWECQIEGILSLIEEEVQEEGQGRSEMAILADEILARASGANKKEIEKEGKDFQERVDVKILGRYLYGNLFSLTGKEGIKESLASPVALFGLIGNEEDEERLFSPEALFFISQLHSLLS